VVNPPVGGKREIQKLQPAAYMKDLPTSTPHFMDISAGVI
jgi:hypothetical protein